MKILAPARNVDDVEKLAAAGADEIYCGVLPAEWKKKYTNVIAPNRRSWSAANLKSYRELSDVVRTAHARRIPVLLTLNTFYTQQQYPLIFEQIEQAAALGVDALIVSDIGILTKIRNEGVKTAVHLSTSGTAFNTQTALFYRDLGVSRITLPRQLTSEEVRGIVQGCPSLAFEVLVLNSGCKNIDGFCTFLHGMMELRYGALWKTMKTMNFDRFVLRIVHLLSRYTGRRNIDLAGVDSPCLLRYALSVVASPPGADERTRHLTANLSSFFGILSGVDPCGACRVREFMKTGIRGLKIAGRNYSIEKKVADVRFLKAVVAAAESTIPDDEFISAVRARYAEFYGMGCRDLCYYPS